MLRTLRYLLLLLLLLFISTLSSVTAFAEAKVEVLVYHAPPYIIDSDGKLNGITMRLMEAGFREAGLQAEFQSYPFARSIAMCAERPNCIWIGSLDTLTNEIQGELFQVAFVKYTSHFFYNHAKHPEYQRTQYSDDFTGKSIGLFANEYGSLEAFRKKGVEIHTLSTHTALFQMLMSGRLDYAHFVSLIGYIEIAKHPDADIRALNQALISSEGGLIFKDKQLAQQVQQAFIRLKQQGTLAKLVQQELGSQLNVNANEIIPDTISLSSRIF